MRSYVNKNDRQKKAYHSDRFRIAPTLPRLDVNSDEVFKDDVKKLEKFLHVKKSYIELGQLVVWLQKDDILKALDILKQNGYENLSELSAVDFVEKQGGFELFYQLLSMEKHKRMRLKCFVKKDEHVQSVISVYKSADWAEREVYDMFGIVFLNHPNLKRLLMPDDWHGHPLLKTYPLQGDEDAQWYEIDKIFGKEYRDVVGPEQRDCARVDESDTKNFARIYHEVPYATPHSKEKTVQEYQEDGGVTIVKKLKKDKGKTIRGRR